MENNESEVVETPEVNVAMKAKMEALVERLQNLNLSEWQLIRKMSGFGFKDFGMDVENVLFDENFMGAVIYMLKKREDPQYKHSDALNLSYVEAIEVLGLGDEDDDPKA